MGSYVIGAKSLAVAKQYTQALNRAARQGFSSGVVPQERRSLTYASGSGKAVVTDSEYQGMFKLSVVEKQEENATNYYLNVAWPSSSYSDTPAGLLDRTRIYWTEDIKMDSDADVYIDPFAYQLKVVKEGDLTISSWILVGHYSNETHKVTQILEVSGTTAVYDGYSGQFAIHATEDKVEIVETDSADNTHCGQAQVNNLTYYVKKYASALPNETTYYYIRHTFSESTDGEEEDASLSDDEKLTLRTQISTTNSQISEYSKTISLYNSNLRSLEEDRDLESSSIGSIYTKYDNYIYSAERSRDAEVKQVNDQIANLDSSDEHYAENLDKLNSQIVQIEKDYASQIELYETNREDEIKAVKEELNSLASQISSVSKNIKDEYNLLTSATNSNSTANLRLYGVIPSSAKCEIVELTSPVVASQTDQYLYIYIGSITINENKVVITQVYQGGNISAYRLGTNC